ncbi:hypothetical protein LCGC14_2238300, partial [marine sediment metagenome]
MKWPAIKWPVIRWPKLKRPDLDARDGHIYGGLLVASVGGWQVSWPWTCIVLGVVVMVLGIFAPRMARR